MIQDQLVEYITSQTKLGVSRDAIKTTLTAAGWQAADVEDTLKKVEASRTSQPITAAPATPGMPAKPTGAIAPQTMRVSDLISGVDPMGGIKGGPVGQPAASMSKSPLIGSPATSAASSPLKKEPTEFHATEYPAKSSKGSKILPVILGILMLAAMAGAGFLYYQNSQLSAKIASVNSQSTQLNGQVNSIQQQVTASTTNLQAQITQLTTDNQELKTELSFYAVSPSAVQGTTSSATLSGMISGGGKNLFLLTTTNGSKIYVVNSKDAKVIAALTPLVGSSTAQVAGTYISGSDSITITAVNGATL
jgi:hypothetical protein